jgi:Ca2+/Na+ antiporter
MNSSIDSIELLNLALCIIVLLLGLWQYTKTRSKLVLKISLAFGLFGITHLMMLIPNLGTEFTFLIMSVGVIAYVLVVFGLYSVITLKKPG